MVGEVYAVFRKAWFLPLYCTENSVAAVERLFTKKSGKKSYRIIVWPARPLKQIRIPHIGDRFYYEILARLMSRALSRRKWLTHCAQDKWIVGILNRFLS